MTPHSPNPSITNLTTLRRSPDSGHLQTSLLLVKEFLDTCRSANLVDHLPSSNTPLANGTLAIINDIEIVHHLRTLIHIINAKPILKVPCVLFDEDG